MNEESEMLTPGRHYFISAPVPHPAFENGFGL
jgi:hypothetical protein